MEPYLYVVLLPIFCLYYKWVIFMLKRISPFNFVIRCDGLLLSQKLTMAIICNGSNLWW